MVYGVSITVVSFHAVFTCDNPHSEAIVVARHCSSRFRTISPYRCVFPIHTYRSVHYRDYKQRTDAGRGVRGKLTIFVPLYDKFLSSLSSVVIGAI